MTIFERFSKSRLARLHADQIFVTQSLNAGYAEEKATLAERAAFFRL